MSINELLDIAVKAEAERAYLFKFGKLPGNRNDIAPDPYTLLKMQGWKGSYNEYRKLVAAAVEEIENQPADERLM